MADAVTIDCGTGQVTRAPAGPPSQAAVPRVIDNWQGIAVLKVLGWDTAVEQAIAGITDPTQAALTAIAYASADFTRDSPTINQILKALGKTDAEIDDAFIRGAALTL